jgi:hypothetical protein
MLLGRVPAFVQMDFSGEWAAVQDEDGTGDPHVGEFIGIPMSHQGLLRVEEWNASLYTLVEHSDARGYRNRARPGAYLSARGRRRKHYVVGGGGWRVQFWRRKGSR